MFNIIDYSSSLLNSLANGSFSGIIRGLSNRIYHSLPQISSTQLKNISAKSPLHYKYELDHPSDKKSDSMILGSAMHTQLLEPSQWEAEFFVMQKVDLRTKEGKHLKAVAEIEAVKKMVITDVVASDAFRMVDSVRAHKPALDLLNKCENELSLFWKCPYSGLSMRAKIDALCLEFFIEVKSSVDASPSVFSRQCFNLNYDLSLVHYQTGIRVLTGLNLPAYFIVVESDAPYVVQVYKVSDDWFETGLTKWTDAVDKMFKGLKQNEWHSYSYENEITTLGVPPWALKKETLTEALME